MPLGYNNFGVKIEGLQFNHRGNTTVSGCIQGTGASNLRIIRCAVEYYNTKAGYAGISLNPITPGNDNTNCFWTYIDNFTTRERSGSDGTIAAIGIHLVGACNATKITNCSFSSVTDAIRFDNDGVGNSLANAVMILHNDFESLTNAITIPTQSGAYTPYGLHVAFNRVEALTTFINLTGTLATDPPSPMLIESNYITNGSVTNYILNPNNQLVFINESNYFAPGTGNKIGGPQGFNIITDGSGHNLVLTNLSGSSDYTNAHLVMGPFHTWFNNSTGNMQIKGSTPSSASDGATVLATSTVSSSSTSTVTNKIAISINGTTYYLLASTSGT